MKQLKDFKTLRTIDINAMPEDAKQELFTTLCVNTKGYYEEAKPDFEAIQNNKPLYAMKHNSWVWVVYPDNSGCYAQVGIAEYSTRTRQILCTYNYAGGGQSLNEFLNNVVYARKKAVK